MYRIEVLKGYNTASGKKCVQVIIGAEALHALEDHATEQYRKPFAELTYDEASTSVSGLIAGLSGDPRGMVRSSRNKVIVDIEKDGEDAYLGLVNREARNLLPEMDDERDLIVSVARNHTMWDLIRRRDPQIDQDFLFRNEPPEYV